MVYALRILLLAVSRALLALVSVAPFNVFFFLNSCLGLIVQNKNSLYNTKNLLLSKFPVVNV